MRDHGTGPCLLSISIHILHTRHSEPLQHLERSGRTKWDALLFDPDYEDRKEEMMKVQAEAGILQKWLDAVEGIA